jgi:hypothetical protein
MSFLLKQKVSKKTISWVRTNGAILGAKMFNFLSMLLPLSRKLVGNFLLRFRSNNFFNVVHL